MKLTPIIVQGMESKFDKIIKNVHYINDFYSNSSIFVNIFPKSFGTFANCIRKIW